MKKATAILLALLLVLALTACGSQAPAKESPAAKEQTEAAAHAAQETVQAAETAQPVETTQPVETVAPTEPEEETPAFDTSWAANDFEKLIPQPPFEGWTGTATADNVYEMETASANADEILKDDGSWLYYDIWAEYVQTLSGCGFVMDGDVYKASGSDANGNSVELMCGDGHAWITITKK